MIFDDGSWELAVEAGKKLAVENPTEIPSRIASSKIEDDATIVYTSGTSGQPKGVVLTQRQVMSEISDIMKIFKIDHLDQTLSFLPFAHVLGRVEMWLSILAGYTLGFAESIDKIKNNLTEIPPTVIISVPRIFEKIFAAVSAQLDRKAVFKNLFSLIALMGSQIENRIKGKLLSGKIRPAFGGRLRFAISGGAPLGPDIAAFFRSAGIEIYEGYGLTETTGAITVNTPIHFRRGTVGRPLPDVQIHIAEDGEILVKSDKVMSGYFHGQESGIRDGFFPTGDIGHLEEGFLRITDRKKDLIKTSGGKYVAPQKLENALEANPFISQVLIHGDREKYIVALITLNEPDVKRWAQDQGVAAGSYKDLSQSAQVRDVIAKVVSGVNSGLASYETIKKFAILDHDFTIEADELTPSLKVKRKFCEQKYREILQSLY